MSDSLEIHVNRQRPNVLEVPEMYVADRDFAIEIINDGKPVHVHVNLDDELLELLEVDTGNHFVARENTFRLPVTVRDGARPVRGKLKISTGYGSESRFIELRVVEPTDDDRVVVDAELSEPPDRRQESELTPRIVGEIGAIALLGVALIALLVAASIVGTVTSPVIGVLAVVVGLLVVVGVYLFL